MASCGWRGLSPQGGTLRLETAVAPGRIFALTVEEATPPRRKVWAGGFPLIFGGKRTFTLTQVPGGTDFHMAEVFRGLMLPLIWRSLPDMQPGFETFAEGLKRMAESTG